MGGGEGRAESSQSEVEACGAFSQRGEGSTISTVFMNINAEPPTCGQDHPYNLLQFFRIF